jgi:hypothetical protein
VVIARAAEESRQLLMWALEALVPLRQLPDHTALPAAAV